VIIIITTMQLRQRPLQPRLMPNNNIINSSTDFLRRTKADLQVGVVERSHLRLQETVQRPTTTTSRPMENLERNPRLPK
jgi:hypothetical protein